MPRFRDEQDEGDGWTRWVRPVMQGYKMACCDCGLVHDMDFRVMRQTGAIEDDIWVEDGSAEVEFKVRRNNRSTGQMRRHIPKDEIDYACPKCGERFPTSAECRLHILGKDCDEEYWATRKEA